MDGGDLREIDARELALEVLVVGVFGQHLTETRGDLAAQLGGSGAGIGDDQKFVQIRRVVRVGQVAHQAVDEHLGLAGACGRGPARRPAAREWLSIQP